MAPVLFICTGNACRSPMAEGLARAMGIDAESAGVIAAGVHPRAVEVMRELHIDISGHRSRSVAEAPPAYDVVVTLCDYARSVLGERPRARRARFHVPVDDPIQAVGSDEEVRAEFRRARDEIRTWIERHRRELRSG